MGGREGKADFQYVQDLQVGLVAGRQVQSLCMIFKATKVMIMFRFPSAHLYVALPKLATLDFSLNFEKQLLTKTRIGGAIKPSCPLCYRYCAKQAVRNVVSRPFPDSKHNWASIPLFRSDNIINFIGW